MIELVDTFPDTNVQPAEYKRLLGYPRDRAIDGRARELTDWARGWFAKHGRPWVYAREVEAVDVTNGSVRIDGVPFTSTRLQKTLVDAGAHAAVLVAVSAGPEVEAEAQRLWREEKPDEYFFLEIYGSAVVEHLVTTTGARLCAWGEGQGVAVLPHYSPGYPEWDIAQQPRLLELIKRAGAHRRCLPSELDVLESGMLRPKKSLLAVFGVTRQADRVRKLTDLVPCQNCSLAACQYRRAPYRRAAMLLKTEVSGQVADAVEAPAAEPEAVPLDPSAKYLTNVRALRRWSEDRLTLDVRDDGSVDALFRYEGTTCGNLGLAFHYTVKLGPPSAGYPILAQQCAAAPGDTGHTRMCRYMNNAEHLMVAIDREKPLLGQRLNDVLAWQRPLNGAGCYCEPNSRKHKWGLVLETIHYALVRRERGQAELLQQPEQVPQEARTS